MRTNGVILSHREGRILALWKPLRRTTLLKRLRRVAYASLLRAVARIAQSLFFMPRGDVTYICYIDESGTAETPGTSSHFILAGVSIPIWHWKDADREASIVLAQYGLRNEELHTGWLLRSYYEQSRVPNFERLSWDERRSAVQRVRAAHLLRLQQAQNRAAYRQLKKNHAHTHAYIHLTKSERTQLVHEVARCVAGWGFARIFSENIDKLYFDPVRTHRTVNEQAFEQVVSRFELFLENMESINNERSLGILVHDNNETVARKHTALMRSFLSQGTLWTTVNHIIETPLFVDSKLTRMVQIADLISYAFRRYHENQEADLMRQLLPRAHRSDGIAVGIRHYTSQPCGCEVCAAHSGV